MRRTLAVVCIALGVFSIALAPMLRFWVAEALMKAPMDYYSQLVNQGEDVTYFSIEDLEQVEGATVEAYTTVRGDVAASDDETAVWDQFTWIEDTETGFGIDSTMRRAAHDRVTGEAVDCCDPSIDEETVPHEGQVFKFPFLTERKDYEFFDTTLQEVRPIEFEGEETVEGVQTYKFVQTIEPTKIGERDIPRELIDMEGEGDVTADEMYSNTRTYWIDPTTGASIDLHEEQYRGAYVDDEEVLTLFEGDMVWTDETIEGQIESAQEGMTFLPLLRTTLPIVLLAVGAGLIVLGAALLIARPSARGKH